MTWNYRLTKQKDEFAIREVYYDDYNKVVSWSADPISLSGESRKEVMKDIRRITECLREPVIDLDHIEKGRSLVKVLNEHLNNGCTDSRCVIDPNHHGEFTDAFIEHLAEEVQKESNDQP